MMRLPPELSNWVELLKVFPQEIALSLGTIIRSLYAAIGPMKKKVLFGETEPCGFQGIHNRGRITHLLPSEWLLADEVPDEFNRRAAMNEQLYFYPQNVEPKQALISTVLFDSGLSQLGGPRIVHLALLILLARRAQASRAEFYWGILQSSPKDWQTEVNPNTIENNLLKSVATVEVVDTDIDQWQSQLASLGKVTDRWVIGGDSIESAAGLGTCIKISEEIDPQNKILSIQIIKNARATSFQVELPDDATAARMIRNPFKSTTAETKRSKYKINPHRRLQFSRDNRKILVGIKGGLVSYPIPNSPALKIGKPRYFKAFNDERIVAYEVIKKSICTVTYKDQKLTFHRFPPPISPHPFTVQCLKTKFHVPAENQSAGRLFFFPGHLTSQAYLMDGQDNLFRIRMIHHPGRNLECQGPVLIDRKIVAAQAVGQTLVYAACDDKKNMIRLHFGEDNSKIAVSFRDGATGITHLGNTGWREDSIGLMAINTQRNLWRLTMETQSCLLAPPSGSIVVGVIIAPDCSNEKPGPRNDKRNCQPGIILLENDKRQVTLLNKKGLHTLFRLSDTISQIEVAQQHNLIGIITSNRVIRVFSIKHKTFLMEVLSGKDE